MTSSTIKTTFSHRRWRHVAGVMLSLITAIVMIPGMSVYLPFSTPDKIGIPIFLFPFIWVFLFLYAYMARHACALRASRNTVIYGIEIRPHRVINYEKY
jgi:urea transporter